MGARLDAAIAARSTGRVGNFWAAPAPAPVAPLVHARVLLTFAAPSTLAAVQQYQADRGGVLAQPARLQPMRTMGAEARCERCHKQACGCPPPAPQTLTLVVQQKAADIARQAAADTAAGLEPITKVVGMS